MKFIGFIVGSGGLIGMILLIRIIFRRRISPGMRYALWLIPAIRLLFPFTLIPVFVLPETSVPVLSETVNSIQLEDISTLRQEDERTDISETGIHLEKNGEAEKEDPKRESVPDGRKMSPRSILFCVWLSGSMLCACYVYQINRRLKRSVKQMERMTGKGELPVYIRRGNSPPCLFGFFHPCILLCRAVAENAELCRQALLHEEAHYRQRDHIWTAFRIFLCIVYWWNPLVWLGAACAREDAEFACDARALRGAGLPERKAYGYALLQMAQRADGSRMFAEGITPVSGRGKNMKRRLENIVAEDKKTRLWTLPVCILLALFLCGFCFPAQRTRAEEEEKSSLNIADGSDSDTAVNAGENEIKKSRTEESGREKQSGIPIQPQKHREGYRETKLRYSASADWLTDLSGMPKEQERVETLAKRAIRELYDLTGYLPGGGMLLRLQ